MRDAILLVLWCLFFTACGGGRAVTPPPADSGAQARQDADQIREPPPTMSTPNPTTVSEEVRCSFSNSTSTQECSSSKGSCSGVDGCSVTVSGAPGEKLTWSSSCEGTSDTVIDGKNETVAFDCAPSTGPVETVTCVFAESTALQECYAPDVHLGSVELSCSGVTSCSTKVSGKSGTLLTWKSSCGGYTYSIIDGVSDTVTFYCGPQGVTNEEVTCVFAGSTSEQECHSNSATMGPFICRGVSSCMVTVSGKQGTKLQWKSTCNGSVSTVVDASAEQAVFSCK